MRVLALVLVPLLALAAYLAPAQAAAQACTASNGTFRFMNDQFPPLSTNGPVFTGQLVVANADGTVTFAVDPGSKDPLPLGLSLDPDTGLITGLATQSGNEEVTSAIDEWRDYIVAETLADGLNRIEELAEDVCEVSVGEERCRIQIERV